MTKVPTTRVDRLLSSLGYGSRGQIAQMARRRQILLDGEKVTDATKRIPMTADLTTRMTVHNAPLDALPGMVVMLHKPPGYVCSRKESAPLVFDLLPDRWRLRKPLLSPVGRLDKDTSGLLLLTDDGDLLHRITSPNQAVAKTYVASLARPLKGHEADVFASGELLLAGEKKPLHPATLNMVSPTEARLTITEGRYHQVRRMFAAVGNHVKTLHRESLGQLTLPQDLNEGEWKLLTEPETLSILAK